MSDSISLPSYTDYPNDKPFINIHLHRTRAKPVKAFPESSGAAILSALGNLQEKIRQLERERREAEENLQRLSREASRCRKALEREKRDGKRTGSDGLTAQLAAAESRCKLLEKQLEYMRRMVRSAESERTAVLKEQVSLETQRSDVHGDVRAKFAKLDLLEREYQKLTKTQSLAENKIRHLEEKLREEEHQRKLVQDKAAQLQTGLEANRILLQSVSPRPSQSKKKSCLSKNPLQHRSHAQPHYRLSLGDVPFVAGKSTGTSHSVRANVQRVLHLMKQHNPQLCNHRVLSTTPLTPSCSRSSSSSSSGIEELSELLLALQDEFGQMSFEHQQVVKQIEQSHSDRLRHDLERALESLVKRMESKGEQIAKVRRYQTQVSRLRKESRGKRDRGTEGRAVNAQSTRGQVARQIKAKPGDKCRDSLQLLRDMKSIQSSLLQDTVSWDC